MRIGVVCEGSHDFLLLRELVTEQLTQQGYGDIVFEAVQPRVDATSMQKDRGGWAAVVEWCKRNSGGQWDVYFNAPIFATSAIYDAIVIHLDGDVVRLSGKFTAAEQALAQGGVGNCISVVEGWIQRLVQPSPSNAANLLGAVPVLHAEAWILAGLQMTPTALERRKCKGRAKRLLRKRYTGSAVSQVEKVCAVLREALQQIRQNSHSYDVFYQKVAARFP
jgi:hypothetical protein